MLYLMQGNALFIDCQLPPMYLVFHLITAGMGLNLIRQSSSYLKMLLTSLMSLKKVNINAKNNSILSPFYATVGELTSSLSLA